MEMELEGVGDLALQTILSKLGPKDTAVVACVSKKFRYSASDESLWFKFCSQDLDLSAPLDPLGNPTSSFKATYQSWREAFGMYPWPLVKRVKRCWGRLNNWLYTNFPEAVATLQKGASEAEIEELENSLKVKLPLPTRILYRFYDGQDLTSEDFLGSVLGSSLGLIGGYTFYNHSVNVYLLPLSQIILATKEIIRHIGFPSISKYIVVAASSTHRKKLFFLDWTSGQLYVGTRNLSTDGEMIPCVPNALIGSVHDFNGDQQQDAMLLWLEEHVRRLQDGIIKLRNEGRTRSINLFPETPPLCSIAVTNGVQIRASAVFVPESSNLQDEFEKYIFSYSIRMCLLPEGCIINGMSFSSCQLYWRHWVIRADDVEIDHVSGEAVIGQFPLLHPGGEEFVYESCSSMPSSPGSIEGAFTFVPGRFADIKGGPFQVEVARFPLQIRASAVFVPESSNLQDEFEKYIFSYSIRMCLLPEGCIINGMSFSSCQLYWRHWVIRADDVEIDHVSGEAVIGQFPLLHPGGEEFVYESCSSMPSSPGSIEGAFTFVPGRFADIKGGPFQVEVARFPLQVPDYIF